MLFAKKKGREKKHYDPACWKPVVRCSICTGEMAAGFKETATGRFEEVMLIRSDRDHTEPRRAGCETCPAALFALAKKAPE